AEAWPAETSTLAQRRARMSGAMVMGSYVSGNCRGVTAPYARHASTPKAPLQAVQRLKAGAPAQSGGRVGFRDQRCENASHAFDEDLPFAAGQRLAADQAFDKEADVAGRQHAGARVGVGAAEPFADRPEESVVNDHVQERRGGGRRRRAKQELEPMGPRLVGVR